ncbi:MAG: glucose-6-phosphate dehydrogenase [Bdellovibrionales bacterium]|nr:glucose-6-phosphate dehydrogenase [Bdellovibrionales bacterium]
MINPFATGENRLVEPPATALIIFGASGDLTHRKLVPALYNLFLDVYLPSDFIVLGVSRSEKSDEDFRKSLKKAAEEHSRRKISKTEWDEFSKKIFYVSADVNKQQGVAKLKKRLNSLCSKETPNYLYYYATAPSLFAPISANLDAEGLIFHDVNSIQRSSVIVEKPIGSDGESAKELNLKLRKHFAEKQIFRIDHYLGKETVQNILVFRFANGIFEPLWNNKFIDHIQITTAENIGVGSRADYFDSHGITRDIIQNHILQMLSLLCIDPPNSLSDADSIRNEKVKVLSAVRKAKQKDVLDYAVRAQYQSGFINGQSVSSYKDEQGVSAGSITETFSAIRLEIDSWRWANVPIYIRCGKRMPKKITEIAVYFKTPPSSLFKGRQVGNLEPNVLTIQVQPDESISMKVFVKAPGPRLRVRPVIMDFNYHESFAVPSPAAYERLLLDAMKGDPTLFARNDEIEAAWSIVDPILYNWENQQGAPLYFYEAGTWGPDEAEALLLREGRRWREL